MRSSILFTLAAGLFGSFASAQQTFSDAVTFSLHHTKGDNTHFKTTVGQNIKTDRTLDKTARGIYLIGGVNQNIAFEWSPDTSKIPIQSCTAWFSADPKMMNVKWNLDDGAGALAPIQNPPKRLVDGSTHVECSPRP